MTKSCAEVMDPSSQKTVDDFIRLGHRDEEELKLWHHWERRQQYARLPQIPHRNDLSSLGTLDVLPAEVMDMIVGDLDLQSLSRLSRVCLKGRVIVETSPSFRAVMQYIPNIVTALARIRLIQVHSATLLHLALQSKTCVSCSKFGGYLLLLTCERACHDCLEKNVALWSIYVEEAVRFFELENKDIWSQISVGVVSVIHDPYEWESEPFGIVNVRQAKERALRTHGSMEAVEILKVQRFPLTRFPGSDLEKERIICSAELGPPDARRDMSRIPGTTRYMRYNDFQNGEGVMRFPTLTSDGLDFGRLCRGCEQIYYDFEEGMLPEKVTEELVEPLDTHKWPAWVPLEADCLRLHSKDEFREHVQQCYGVQQILAQQDDE